MPNNPKPKKQQKNNLKNPDCLFCKIVQGLAPSHQVYENDQVLAFLDIYPKAEGHTLVIPKKHSVNLFDAPDEDVSAVMKVVKKLAKGYQTALDAEGFVVRINNGEIANQIIPHLHVHLIPVYQDAHKNKTVGEASQDKLRATAQTITSHLQSK